MISLGSIAPNLKHDDSVQTILKALESDLRRVMEPNTAPNLKVGSDKRVCHKHREMANELEIMQRLRLDWHR